MKMLNSRIITFAVKFMYNSNMGFNADKYWKTRAVVMDCQKNIFLRIFALRYVSRINTKFCANIYTALDVGCQFDSPPVLPHQLNGIFIASTARLGKNVTILQQVTIGGKPSAFDGSAPVSQAAVIGDNVIIGAGAKIIGNVRIGNNSVIGANAVVIKDVQANCIAVGVPAVCRPKK